MTENRSGFWSLPWGFPQAMLLASALLANGWLIQLASGGASLKPPSLPGNLVGLGGLWAALALVSWKWGSTAFVRWLGGIPMSLASLGHLGLLALISGIVPQGSEGWLTNIVGTWSFALTLLLVLVNLGLATLRRLFRFRGMKDLAFLANHVGIWVVLAAMAAGAGDLKRVRITAPEGATVTTGIAQDGSQGGSLADLPFGINLQKFTLEEYPPKLVYFEMGTETPEKPKAQPRKEPKAGDRLSFREFDVEILEALPHAAMGVDTYVLASQPNGVAAWKVKLLPRTPGMVTREGWISAGKGSIQARALHTENGVLAMLEPEARFYRSDVLLTEMRSKTTRKESIIVNKPLEVEGWKLYQASYEPDAATGEVRVSIFEAIWDPWLPVIYVGAFLMIAGSAHLFFTGLQKRNKVTT